MEKKQLKVMCRGRLVEGNTLNWYDGNTKVLPDNGDDFIFVLINDYDFCNNYKFIQDNNNLEFLKIQEITESLI